MKQTILLRNDSERARDKTAFKATRVVCMMTLLNAVR